MAITVVLTTDLVNMTVLNTVIMTPSPPLRVGFHPGGLDCYPAYCGVIEYLVGLGFINPSPRDPMWWSDPAMNSETWHFVTVDIEVTVVVVVALVTVMIGTSGVVKTK